MRGRAPGKRLRCASGPPGNSTAVIETEGMASSSDTSSQVSADEDLDVEQTLCLRVKQQDVRALGVLLQRWRPWLMGRVRRRLGSSQPAGRRPSDVVQEACVLALRFVGDFRGESCSELRAWLTSILQTAIAQTQRHAHAHRRSDAQTTVLDEELTASSPRVSQIVSSRQGYREVVAAIARLPIRQRDVLYWRLLEERSLAEIADRLNESEQAAASLIKRGLSTLRTKLRLDRPSVKKQSAARVDTALLEFLRLSDRGQAPTQEEFLQKHANCSPALAPILDWLRDVRLRLSES